MPHLLVAGATGAGKSVGMNVMLVSLLASEPDKVRMILIDPNALSLHHMQMCHTCSFPLSQARMRLHLFLKWVVQEMELRYEIMAQAGVRKHC